MGRPIGVTLGRMPSVKQPGGSGPLMEPGEIFDLFRRAGSDGLTKTELARVAGLSRTTANQRLRTLLRLELLVPTLDGSRTVGRPADRFMVNDRYGVVLVADMGASGLRVALCDMNARVLAQRAEDSDIASGPVTILDRLLAHFGSLLDEHGIPAAQVRAIGIDVPGPVNHARGRVVSPPIMTGWHDFDIPAYVRRQIDAPVLVENDVNAMAFGEHRLSYPDVPQLVFVKVGTGIGAGIIVEGMIYRGADGAAGDIGHVQIDDTVERMPSCRCGRLGCIEAHAGGWALLRDLSEAGLGLERVSDVVRAIREGHPIASSLYRQASQVVGTAVSDVVSLLDPRVVVLGGQLAAVNDSFIAGVREVVYRRSLPLATRELRIVTSRLGLEAGVHGMTRLALDDAFSPARVNALTA